MLRGEYDEKGHVRFALSDVEALALARGREVTECEHLAFEREAIRQEGAEDAAYYARLQASLDAEHLAWQARVARERSERESFERETLSEAQAAQALGLQRHEVWRLRRAGLLRTRTLGFIERYEREDVIELLVRRRTA